MALKQDRVYERGRSMYVAPSAQLVIGFNDEHNPKYLPPGTNISALAARAFRAMPKKLASGVVTASQSDEELTLTDTPSGSATYEEQASGSLGVSWYVKAFKSIEVPAPSTSAQFASSDEADSHDSTSGSPIGALTPVADQSNRWCVNRQYQMYSDSMFLNHKGIIPSTLTL